ncbi:cysteine-rich receptor-like protein kinase 44 [Syzygium oleosum]|uniref:cysteine-rich receptor-like protein kinase 44 n=1 Tax=Syzygium oleosum TaxID=219896 RepID=UPI0024B97704|nr:cysteine-rich receptor-like protein kinase 44 [Syzygium oleosum]
MTSSFTISLRLLYSINLLISISHVSEAAPDPIGNYCPDTKPFLPNSTYQKNLNNLLSSLSSAADSAGDNISSSGRFTNATAGQDPPDQAHGIFLCRGDIDAVTCSDCIATAAKDIIRQCPGEKTSIIWYDTCMLRYSNQPIYSVMQQVPVSIKMNGLNITDDRSRFVQLLGQTLDYVVRTAPSIRSGKKVAAAEAELASSRRLYTLAECTPDLMASDCGACIRSAIARLHQDTPGGRVLSPSCNVRFEVYPFYNAAALVTVATVGTPPPVQLPSAPAPATGPKGRSNKSTVIRITAIAVSVGVLMVFLSLACCFVRRKATKTHELVQEEAGMNKITSEEPLQYDLAIIQAATKNFSHLNKLGEGGFGEVFQGRLPNEQDIAVKRLSQSSRQVAEELKNEVMLVAKLQHRNLVRLLGYCLEGEEKLLVYEFVPNKSLDYFLYDPEKSMQLDWLTRYKIALGIARGMLYLHEDSRLRIIHRDLKASNVLLDSGMNPKISDFGTARSFGVDQTHASTNKIVGTFGYMPPEYARDGKFSVKSDIYSFGVLLLEIIIGKKIDYFCRSEGGEDLASYAWRHWRDGTPLEVLDPAILDLDSRDEVRRCLHISLLCVQEDPIDRPTMTTVLHMLSSQPVAMPQPRHPAFFPRSRDQSISRSIHQSVNRVTITEVYPR